MSRSLIPKAMREAQAVELDLPEIFEGLSCKATRTRVIGYLSTVYEKHSRPEPEKIFVKNSLTEEFYLPMPTVDAFNSEIALCQGIRDHAGGKISDQDAKVLLEKFLETHILVHRFGGDPAFSAKAGDLDNWTKTVKLFYLSWLDGGAAISGQTVNAIQAWLLYLIEQGRGSKGFKCVEL